MVIPDFEMLTTPMLNYASDQQEHSNHDIIEFLAHKYNLSNDESKELLPSRGMPIFDNIDLEGTRRGYRKPFQHLVMDESDHQSNVLPCLISVIALIHLNKYHINKISVINNRSLEVQLPPIHR